MNNFWKFIKTFLKLLPLMIILFPFGVWYCHYNDRLDMKDSIIGSIIGGLFCIFMVALGKVKNDE